MASIRKKLAGIAHVHRKAGHPDSPGAVRKHMIVREVLSGIRKMRGYGSETSERRLQCDLVDEDVITGLLARRRQLQSFLCELPLNRLIAAEHLNRCDL